MGSRGFTTILGVLIEGHLLWVEEALLLSQLNLEADFVLEISTPVLLLQHKFENELKQQRLEALQQESDVARAEAVLEQATRDLHRVLRQARREQGFLSEDSSEEQEVPLEGF